MEWTESLKRAINYMEKHLLEDIGADEVADQVNNSSKIALITLAEKLKEENFAFIDCQVHTDHLESMGAKFVEWDEFKRMLNDYCSIFPYVDTQSV